MTSLINLQALWNLEYRDLFEDLNEFTRGWKKVRKCKCENPECKHYQKEKQKRYGTRIDKLFNSSLGMKAYSFMEIEKKVH